MILFFFIYSHREDLVMLQNYTLLTGPSRTTRGEYTAQHADGTSHRLYIARKGSIDPEYTHDKIIRIGRLFPQYCEALGASPKMLWRVGIPFLRQRDLVTQYASSGLTNILPLMRSTSACDTFAIIDAADKDLSIAGKHHPKFSDFFAEFYSIRKSIIEAKSHDEIEHILLRRYEGNVDTVYLEELIALIPSLRTNPENIYFLGKVETQYQIRKIMHDHPHLTQERISEQIAQIAVSGMLLGGWDWLFPTNLRLFSLTEDMLPRVGRAEHGRAFTLKASSIQILLRYSVELFDIMYPKEMRPSITALEQAITSLDTLSEGTIHSVIHGRITELLERGLDFNSVIQAPRYNRTDPALPPEQRVESYMISLLCNNLSKLRELRSMIAAFRRHSESSLAVGEHSLVAQQSSSLTWDLLLSDVVAQSVGHTTSARDTQKAGIAT